MGLLQRSALRKETPGPPQRQPRQPSASVPFSATRPAAAEPTLPRGPRTPRSLLSAARALAWYHASCTQLYTSPGTIAPRYLLHPSHPVLHDPRNVSVRVARAAPLEHLLQISLDVGLTKIGLTISRSICSPTEKDIGMLTFAKRLKNLHEEEGTARLHPNRLQS